MNPLSLLSSLTGGIWLYVAVFVLGTATGGLATHKVDENHYGRLIAEGQVQLQTEKASHAADLKAVSDKATQAATDALLAEQNMQHHLAALDAQHLKEIQNAQAETDKLRAGVAAGRVRLRIAIAAAAQAGAGSGSAVPATPGAPGVDDGTPAELAPGARQSYFDLRGTLTTAQQQITGLQDYIKTVCLPAQ